MNLDGNQARAARASARRESIEYTIGDASLVFKAEMSLDVLFGIEKAYVADLRGLRLWLLSHLLVDAGCDTSCVDDPKKSQVICPAQVKMHDKLRKIRVDGEPLDERDIDDMWDLVRRSQGVTEEGESSPSVASSATAGGTSSATSGTRSTRRRSSPKGKAESAA